MIESQNCTDFIKQKENELLFLDKSIISFPRYDELASKAQNKEVWDIGYGTRFYPDGKEVRKDDGPIDEEKASEYLKYYVDKCCYRANRVITATLNQSQFDACVSLAYNIGVMPFVTSTLLKTINNNAYDLININVQFRRWKYCNKIEIQGLLNRRNEEFKMYISELDINASYFQEYLNYIGKTNF